MPQEEFKTQEELQSEAMIAYAKSEFDKNDRIIKRKKFWQRVKKIAPVFFIALGILIVFIYKAVI